MTDALQKPRFSVDIFRIKAYYWIVSMEKAIMPSDGGGTQKGFPLLCFLDFCYLPAPQAHSVGHVLISQFLLLPTMAARIARMARFPLFQSCPTSQLYGQF
jgi:hypothetical protein